MYLKITSFMPEGATYKLITLDVHVSSRGIPAFQILGAPAEVGKGISQRIKHAFGACGLQLPKSKISITFSSYNKKSVVNDYFDLHIAYALYVLANGVPYNENICLFGKLLPNGTIEPANTPELFLHIARMSAKKVLVLNCDVLHVTLDYDIELHKLTTIKDFDKVVYNLSSLPQVPTKLFSYTPSAPTKSIRGNYRAKKCIELAVAGRHHLLLVGPPGVGKTMLANAVKSLFTPAHTEAFDLLVRKQLVTGKSLSENESLCPFVATSLSVPKTNFSSQESPLLLGDCGFVFMDEFLEHSRHTLESLKKVLDDKQIAGYSANFTLIAATNPCNCGNYGSMFRTCSCTKAQVHRYREKLSGGLLDRFHLMAYIDVTEDALISDDPIDQDWYVHAQHALSRSLNYELDTTHLSAEVQTVIKKATMSYKLSHRGIQNTLSVASTLAKLSQASYLLPEHILEALNYRPELLV